VTLREHSTHDLSLLLTHVPFLRRAPHVCSFSGEVPGKTSMEYLSDIFQEADTDGTKSLSVDEFAGEWVIRAAIGPYTSALIGHYNKPGIQLLTSVRHFLHMGSYLPGVLNKLVGEVDNDGNRVPSKDLGVGSEGGARARQLTHGQLSDHEIRTIIDLFDQNGDGEIDFAEFSVLCENITDFNAGVSARPVDLPFNPVIRHSTHSRFPIAPSPSPCPPPRSPTPTTPTPPPSFLLCLHHPHT
jgi:hypothetical protein